MAGENSQEVKLSDELKAQFNTLGKSLDAVREDSIKAVDGVKTEMNKTLEAQNKKLDDMEESINMISISAKDSKSDPNRGYQNHIEFFNDVIKAGMNGNNPDKFPERLQPLFNAVGSDESRVASDPDGGFLVPPSFLPGLLETDPQALQTDTEAYTRKIPMATDTVHINARVDKNHSSSVTGGFRVYRREEANDVESSKSKYEQVKLQANSLMGLSYATEEIIARSPISFASLIQSGFKEEKKSKMNYERIWGTGVGEFLGVMNGPSLITVLKESGQSEDTITGTNLLHMKMRCWGYNNAVWMANQDTEEQLTKAHIALTNTDLIRPYNPDKGTIYGRPVIFDENMATVGDLGDLSLINWNEYLEGTLGGISFQESIHVRFVYNERAFRFTIYNDGQPWWKTVLTPKKSSNTLSPFVTLAERA